MRLDVVLLPDSPAPELVDRALLAEEMGFTAVWVADHFVNPYAPESDWFDGWTMLGALAVATSKVRLGPLVSAPALRNPALLALQATTVDHLSGGRLELGLGAGGAPLDLAMTGASAREPAERFARFAETVDIVDTLLTDGTVEHHGTYYDLEARVQRPLKRPRPPLVLGALAPRALRFAAARADCLSTYAASGRLSSGIAQGAEAVEMIEERMRLVDAECARIGRDPGSLRRSLLTFFGYADPLPERGELEEWTRPYREMGIDEFVLYWPSDEDEGKLATLVG
jgi:alkanesulfonate monooxygenase SsuD/methylene tetrahydromethanopterin reductase-like flavin-dependent oxidoreductase (luciferase family)